MRAIVLFLLASAAFAQSGGSVAGKVSDDDGAGVAKAKIQAKNTATGAMYSAESGADGNYKLSSMPAGAYELSASGPGFLAFKQQNLLVDAGQSLSIDIRHPLRSTKHFGGQPRRSFRQPIFPEAAAHGAGAAVARRQAGFVRRVAPGDYYRRRIRPA